MTKIGITITNEKNKTEHDILFNNGINQNILFLYKLFEKQGYDVYFLSNINILNSEYKYINIYDQNKLNSLDYFINIGLQLTESMIIDMKKSNVKLISMHLGNATASYSDFILHNINNNITLQNNLYYEKIWISPHFEYSIDFYKYIHQNENIKVAPYIWEPTFLDKYTGTFDRNNISVGIFEPNLNLNKSSFIPMIICDKAKEYIKKTFVFSSKKLTDNQLFIDFANKSDLVKDRRMTFEDRHKFVPMMNKYCNVVVSFNQDWGLNYLLLECLHLGIPLIHNSPFFKEYGYYYEGYDASGASKHIEDLYNNGFNREEYIEKNKKILYKYSPENPENIHFFVNEIPKKNINIPKNIFQTWKTKELPNNESKKFTEELKKHNPEFNYHFYTDDDIVHFIETYYPEYKKTFDNFKYNIQKIDFFRLLVVYHYGGFYFDIDVNITKNLSDLCNYSCVFPQEYTNYLNISFLKTKNINNLIGNYAFGASPKHPFIKYCIDNIINPKYTKEEINKIIDKHTNNIRKEERYVFFTTGPDFITDCYAGYKDKKDITILVENNKKSFCFGNYGSHKMLGSWKKENNIKENNFIISLTTLPSRLSYLEDCLESLLNQEYKNYEIHINIPIHNKIEGSFKKKLTSINDKIKFFYVEDIGSITRLYYTLHRITDNNQYIIVVDDNCKYNSTMLKTYNIKINENSNSAIGFSGLLLNGEKISNVNTLTEVDILENSNSVCYSRNFFNNDFFMKILDNNIDWCPKEIIHEDDIVISRYLTSKNIKLKVVSSKLKKTDPLILMYPITKINKHTSGLHHFRNEYGSKIDSIQKVQNNIKIPKNIFQTWKTEDNINIVYDLSKNNINIKDVEYVQNVPIVIYLVWFGNTISNNRLNALLSIINNIEIPYIIITNKNYLNYEKENFPIHKNFAHLAVNHKSDYMRAYLLFHYGGLYHDIKFRKNKIHKNEWDVFNNYNIWIKSRKEKYKDWIGYNIEDNNTKWIQDYYNILGTMSLVICRPYTEYLFELNDYITKKLDKNSNLLEKFPAKNQELYFRNTPFELIKDSNIYPIRWLELMGEKFHLLMYKHKNHINLDLSDFEYTNYM